MHPEDTLPFATGLVWRGFPLDQYHLLPAQGDVTLVCTRDQRAIDAVLDFALSKGGHERKECVSWQDLARGVIKGFFVGATQMGQIDPANRLDRDSRFRLHTMLGLRDPLEAVIVGMVDDVYMIGFTELVTPLCALNLLCPDCKATQAHMLEEMLHAPESIAGRARLTLDDTLKQVGTGSIDAQRRMQALTERRVADALLGFRLPPDPALAIGPNRWCVNDDEHECTESLDVLYATDAFFYTRPFDQLDAELRAGLKMYDMGSAFPVDEPSCRVVKMLGMQWLPVNLYDRGVTAHAPATHWYEVPRGAVGLSTDKKGRTIVHIVSFPSRCPIGTVCTHADIAEAVTKLPQPQEIDTTS